MSNWDVYLDQRTRYLEKARAAAFLDAVFFIDHYNSYVQMWEPAPEPPQITPAEVFETLDQSQYLDALTRARQLRAAGTNVGAAFFRYSHAQRTYEDELVHLRVSNPGFADECYDLVSQAGIIAMR